MKLSIITINLNNISGFIKTYQSVVCQTWKDYEWIVIDGGSKDGSLEFIKEHQDLFAFWCSEQDRGVYNAQNKGVSIAKGEYVLFMNSGDCLAYPSTLERVFGVDRKADILFGYMMRKTLDGIPHNIPSMKPNVYWEDFYYDTLPHQSSYIRRSLFDKLGYYDETYARLADWKWFQNAIAFNHATVEFIPHKLSVYECGGISEDNYWKTELFRLREETLPSCIPEEDYQNLRDLHAIYEKSWAKFLYRVLRKFVREYNKRKQQRDFNNVRFKENG